MTIGFIINILLAIYAYKKWKIGDRCMYFVVLQFLIFQTYKLELLQQTEIRSDDLALALVAFTSLQSIGKVKISGTIGKTILVFVVFVVVGMFVSLLFKGLPLIQVVKGARAYFFCLALYDVWLMKKTEIRKTIYYIFLLNMVFSVIFIMQTFLPLHILLDTWDGTGASNIGFLGMRRYYSFPPLIPFCCLYSIFLFPSNKRHKGMYIFISFATLLLIQSRGMLMYTALLVMMAFIIFKASPSNKILYIAISVVIALVVNATVLSGDVGKRTDSDLSRITTGQISIENRPVGDATMSLRIWMLLVRNERLLEGNLMDKVFGLGYFAQINESKVRELGLEGIVCRYFDSDEFFMTTPDISYANIIAYLGYVGAFIYMCILLSLLNFFYKFRKKDKFAQLGMLYMLFLFATGLNGSAISTPTCLLIPFLFMRLVYFEVQPYVKDNKIGFVSPARRYEARKNGCTVSTQFRAIF